MGQESIIPERIFLDKVDDELSCPICLSVLENATITTCGHTFCQKCISTWLQSESSCPVCKEVFDESSRKISKVFVVDKLVGNLRCQCPVCKEWTGINSAYESHLLECPKKTPKLVKMVRKHIRDREKSRVVAPRKRPVAHPMGSPSDSSFLNHLNLLLGFRYLPQIRFYSDGEEEDDEDGDDDYHVHDFNVDDEEFGYDVHHGHPSHGHTSHGHTSHAGHTGHGHAGLSDYHRFVYGTENRAQSDSDPEDIAVVLDDGIMDLTRSPPTVSRPVATGSGSSGGGQTHSNPEEITDILDSETEDPSPQGNDDSRRKGRKNNAVNNRVDTTTTTMPSSASTSSAHDRVSRKRPLSQHEPVPTSVSAATTVSTTSAVSTVSTATAVPTNTTANPKSRSVSSNTRTTSTNSVAGSTDRNTNRRVNTSRKQTHPRKNKRQQTMSVPELSSSSGSSNTPMINPSMMQPFNNNNNNNNDSNNNNTNTDELNPYPLNFSSPWIDHSIMFPHDDDSYMSGFGSSDYPEDFTTTED